MKLQFSVEGDFTDEFLARMQTLAKDKTPTVLMFPTQIVIKSVKKGSGGSGTTISYYEELNELPKGCVIKDKDGDKWFCHGDGLFSEVAPGEGAFAVGKDTFEIYAPWKLTAQEWC